ncbi:MAG: SelB C-terminal domain-containing protein, partial [Gemmatimonadetes bacterium]|nr:SelB C-terminal domain-containing protein [Gemmatimonadota bacterium]
AWAQVRFDEPVAAVKGDRFVVRDTQTTLGGGAIVAPHAGRHRRFHEPTLARLEALAHGSGADALTGALESIEPASEADLARAANLSEAEIRRKAADMVSTGTAVRLGGGGGLLYSARGWASVRRRAAEAVEAYHCRFPLRGGMPREELRSRLRMKQTTFAVVMARLVDEGVLETTEAAARLPGREAKLTAEQEREAARYLQLLAATPYSPPTDSPPEPELLQLLVDQGRVVRTADGVVFLKSVYDEMVAWVIERAREHGPVSISDVRETFGTSRKYTLALLEHMDRTGVTRRVGDDRVPR